MKTTRRKFLQGLIATVATGLVAPQVLVESVHGASDLTAHEREAVAVALGLRTKQWRGFSSYSMHIKFTESETAFSYITYPVLGTDIAGNTGYGQITLPKDMPEEEVRAELEAATGRLFDRPLRATWVEKDEPPAALFGIPLDQGVFREDARGMTWGRKDDPAVCYPVPEEHRRRVLDALSQEWDRQFLEGTGGGAPVGILSGDNFGIRDSDVRDRIAFHLRLDRTETIWTSRGLEPDPDQKSPFVRLR